MDVCIDNSFDWFTGEKIGSCTFSQKKYVNKVKKYAEEYPDDVKILAENEDGSIFVHMPVSWFKISPPRKGREFTDEEKQAAAERLRIAREKRNAQNN